MWPKSSSILICFLVITISAGFARAACPSADVTGDCLVNFLDFQVMALRGDFLDLRTMALQWLEPAEDDADWEPLTLVGRVETGADEPNWFAVEFVVVDKQRVDRSVFKYECKVILQNISPIGFYNVQLGMVGRPENMTIIDPHVTFGDGGIGPAQSATSIDTCTFTVDRFVPINPVEIIWHHITTVGDMVLIPGRTFQMGDSFNESGSSVELPVHTVTLDSFYMGKCEITNGQYCDYLNSAISQGLIAVASGRVYEPISEWKYTYCDTHSYNSGSQIDYSGGIFSVRTKSGRDMSHDPMVHVNWYGAAAYCNWRSQQEGYEQCYDLSTWNCDFSKKGYRLPTEAEWEYAGRGGVSARRFPWGDIISHSQANYRSSNRYSYDTSPTKDHHPTWNDKVRPYTSPTASFAANGYGLYDMAGNVREWCNDWYSPSYYRSSPTINPIGPPPPGTNTNCVNRGGSWGSLALSCRVASRGSYWRSGRNYFLGFRIVLAFPECEAPAVEDVDDMESYTPWTVPGNNIFEIWEDGFGDCTGRNGNLTGSMVTENPEPVLGGDQSMRFDYDNDGEVFNPCTMMMQSIPYRYSKAEAQIAELPSGIGPNWSPCGTTQLVVNFYGQAGNEVEQVDPLWVEIKDAAGNSAKVVYGDRQGEYPQRLTEASWHEWVIDMGEFAEDGVDVTDVASIAIGVGSEGATAPGGSGTLYFDEIRLSTSRQAP